MLRKIVRIRVEDVCMYVRGERFLILIKIRKKNYNVGRNTLYVLQKTEGYDKVGELREEFGRMADATRESRPKAKGRNDHDKIRDEKGRGSAAGEQNIGF
jgi:hypothetical protein